MECYEARRVNQWVSTLWHRLTHERLPPLDNIHWILNNHPSKYRQELAELIDVCSYRAWLNRNMYIYRPRGVIPTGPLLLEIAKHLNVYIRSQLYTDRIKQRNAYLPWTPRYRGSQWLEIWHQIQHLPRVDRGYELLRALPAQDGV